jgi:hypothetical protein
MIDLELNDPAFASVLAQAIGRPLPFTAAECQELTGPLFLQHATSLADLRHCPNLRHLELFACDAADLQPVAALKQLETLRVRCSAVEDMAPLTGCEQLTKLEVSFTFVQELSPLLSLPRLRRGVFLGNPWTAENYHSQRPKLLRRENGKELLLEFSGENEWQLARKLWERGMRLAFAGLDGTRRVLVRPGVPHYTQAACDFIRDEEFTAEALLFELKQRPEPAVLMDALFNNALTEEERNNPGRTFDFGSHRTLGHAAEARQWVERAGLAAERQATLMRFIGRFPTMTFYREDDTVVQGIEAMTSAGLPGWFGEWRKTLAGVMPNHRALVEFDAGTVKQLGGDFRFELNQFRVHWDGRERFAQAGERIVPFTIATSPDAQSLLAVNLADERDEHIYTYNVESLNESFYREGGRTLSDALRVVFTSYADLFDHVSIVTLPGGDVRKQAA